MNTGLRLVHFSILKSGIMIDQRVDVLFQYSYWSEKNRRTELGILELYEGDELPESNVFVFFYIFQFFIDYVLRMI